MIRGVLALVLIAAAVAAAVFFSDHPGQIGITWLGWRIETSVGVAVAALLVAFLALWLVLSLFLGLVRLPERLRRARRGRREAAGRTALTRGLVALAAGDAAAARLQADRALALLDGEPVPLLLAAEAASRQGDPESAGRLYAALLERPDTEFLGLRGLLGQALRNGNNAAALGFATRARALQPRSPWLGETLLELQARAGDWWEARDLVLRAARSGTLPPDAARHHQGVVLFELSRAAERDGDLRRAARLAGKAQALAADLAPPAVQHARLLAALGRGRSAAKAIERAWRSAPHPDLARLYLDLAPERDALARAAALQRLAAQNPGAIESQVGAGEAALTAQLWGEARQHLQHAVDAAPPAGPSRRVCLLMARLAEADPEIGSAREWLDRATQAPRDPCYVCARCAWESEIWTALCPRCGAFDSARWQFPERSEEQGAVAGPMLAGGPEPLILPEPQPFGSPRRSAASAPAPTGLAAGPQSAN